MTGTIHSEADRRAYLEALEVDVWALRETAADENPIAADAAPLQESNLLNWTELRETVSECTLCSLHKTRTQTVFGVGSESADWMIIGEAPRA